LPGGWSGYRSMILPIPTVRDGSIRMLIPYHVTPACSVGERESHVEDPSLVNVVEQVVTLHLTEKTPEELRQLQLEDSPIGLLLLAVENGEKPTADEVRAQGPEAQRLWHLWNRLVVEEGVLKRRYHNTSGKSSWLQLVLPQLLREEVLQELHAGALEGHLGKEKLLGKVKERFYWPGM